MLLLLCHCRHVVLVPQSCGPSQDHTEAHVSDFLLHVLLMAAPSNGTTTLSIPYLPIYPPYLCGARVGARWVQPTSTAHDYAPNQIPHPSTHDSKSSVWNTSITTEPIHDNPIVGFCSCTKLHAGASPTRTGILKKSPPKIPCPSPLLPHGLL